MIDLRTRSEEPIQPPRTGMQPVDGAPASRTEALPGASGGEEQVALSAHVPDGQQGSQPPDAKAIKKSPAKKKAPSTAKPRSKRERMGGALHEILDVEGAAEALGVSRRLVLRLLREGKLPGKKVGREWRILRSAIVQWLKTPEGDSSSPPWLRDAIESGRATLGGKSPGGRE